MLDALHQVVPDQVAGVGFVFEPGPRLRCLDVGAVSRVLRPGPRRIVRTAPAVLVVERVAQRVEGPLPAGRRDVQAPARLQVALRGQHMRVDAAAALAVQDRRPCVAVRLQSRPRRLLELVEDGFDLLIGRPVVGRPSDHARPVPPLEIERVGHGGHHVWIPAQHLDALARLPGRVPLPEEVASRIPRRAGSARQELNVHRGPVSRSEPAPRAPARWRSGGRSPRRPRPPPCGY